MREEPSNGLIDLLQRLSLANRSQVRGLRRRVRRLARDLPLFESVWVDALAQSRILSHFQATEINAGRGESLRVGPFVLSKSLVSPGYAEHYLAREIGSAELVRLALAPPIPDRAEHLPCELKTLLSKSEQIDSQQVTSISRVGIEADRIWVASPHIEGPTAAEWMVQNGRFPPTATLEIARRMAAALVDLEKAGLCHGDLAAWNLTVTKSGYIVLPHPGVRGLFRPEEGYTQADLMPEGYDYLAPERIAEGLPPTVTSDIYACGCLWWHLLTGRPPRPGGTALAKLRAAWTTEIPDVRELAPKTPEPLALAILACVRREPRRRPESMARLAAMLGPPTPAGKLHLARCVSRPGKQPSPWAVSASAARRSKQTPVWLIATVGCLLVAGAVAWAMQSTRPPLPTVSISERPSQPLDSAVAPTPSRPAFSALSNPSQRSATSSLEPATPSATTSVLGLGSTDAGRVPDDTRFVPFDPLRLQPGQCVRGHPDRRPVISVPASGLVVGVEGVRFENIDFVWRHEDNTSAGAAVIELRASGAEFHGCSFQTILDCVPAPVAVRWVHPVDRTRARLSLPSGRIKLVDCVFQGLGGGVACQTIGALAVEMTNVLYLGPGPLIVLDHAPGADEPVALSLSKVTLRGPGPVLECGETAGVPGKIRVRASQSVFASPRGARLLGFVGRTSPRPSEHVEWAGQGSLISPEAAIAYWQRPDGRIEVLDDSSIPIAGLVRGGVEFAGVLEAGPEASRITRWQAPLQSAEPPGANPQSLRSLQSRATQPHPLPKPRG